MYDHPQVKNKVINTVKVAHNLARVCCNGPRGGGGKMQSIWEGTKLIPVKLIGGK